MLSPEQLESIINLKKVLSPIMIDEFFLNFVQIQDKTEFIKLAEGHICFFLENEVNNEYTFLFIKDSIAYSYSVVDKSVENIEYDEPEIYENIQIPLDFTPCTEDELLCERDGIYRDHSSLDYIKRSLEYRKRGKEWLPDNIFEPALQVYHQKIKDSVISCNDEIKKLEDDYKNHRAVPTEYHNRNTIIDNAIRRAENKFYEKVSEIDFQIPKLGFEYREKVETAIKEKIKTINYEALTKKEKEYQVEKLYREFNPNGHRDKYHVSKKDIIYLLQENR